METIKIAHKGKPCDPPIVNGVAFSLVADDVWVGDATPEQVDALLRVSSYRLFGGASAPKPPATGSEDSPDRDLEVEEPADGLPSDADVDALATKAGADDLAKGLGLTLTGDKLLEKKAELKAALQAKREALKNPPVQSTGAPAALAGTGSPE